MKTKPRKKINAKRVEQLAARGLSNEQIAVSIGVSPSTLYSKKKENIELEEAIARGRAAGIEEVSNTLFQKAVEGDNTCIIFYLKCNGWTEAKTPIDVNVNSSVSAGMEGVYAGLRSAVNGEQGD